MINEPNTILGNFLGQSSHDFPMDCETLQGLQELAQIAQLLGNLGGDRIILTGCDQTDNQNRKSGYVFVRTEDAPNGEILHFSGGVSPTNRCYVRERLVNVVTSTGERYDRAYVERELVCQPDTADTESFDWALFVKIRPIRELMETLAGVKEVPVGGIIMWAGLQDSIPEGYLLCDGRIYRKSEYPKLCDALGYMYDEATDRDDSQLGGLGSAKFRVPDLRGRFVMGCNDDVTPGNRGGQESMKLTIEQLPKHSHSVVDYTAPLGSKSSGISSNGARTGTVKVDGGEPVQPEMMEWKGASASAVPIVTSNLDTMQNAVNTGYIQAIPHTTQDEGEGEDVKILPPYYTLAYIIRAN